MQGNDSFRLIMRRGPQPNQTYDLNKDIITVGRDITNDIVINDPEVSRHHLRLTRGAGGYTIEDLGSTNGTFINGQRISGARPLNNGDMIGLGETVTLGYEMTRGASSAAPEDGGASSQTVQSSVPSQPAPPSQPSYSSDPVPPDSVEYRPASSEPQQSSYSSSGTPAQSQSSYMSSPQAPPPADYYEEYDDVGGRSNTTRIVLIGCLVFLVFCCCASLVAAYIIDSQCLWWDLPIIGDVLRAIDLQPSTIYEACQRYYT